MTTQSGSSVSGITDARNDLLKRADKGTSKLYSTTRHYGAAVQAAVAAQARTLFDVTSYDQTITVRMTGGPTNPRAIIHSSAPEAHRLEYGFVGIDSLGRSVHQPPRPHFRPALARFAAQYRASVEGLLQ